MVFFLACKCLKKIHITSPRRGGRKKGGEENEPQKKKPVPEPLAPVLENAETGKDEFHQGRTSIRGCHPFQSIDPEEKGGERMTGGQIWFLIISVWSIAWIILCARMCGNSSALWLYVVWVLTWLALAAACYRPWVSLG